MTLTLKSMEKIPNTSQETLPLDLSALAIPLTCKSFQPQGDLTEEQIFWHNNFMIDHEFSLFDKEGYKMMAYEDLFVTTVKDYPHTTWVAKTDEEYLIAYVLDHPTISVDGSEGHHGVLNTRIGFKTFRMPKSVDVDKLSRRKPKIMAQVESWLDQRFKATFQWVKDNEEQFNEDLCKLHHLHGVRKKNFMLSVVYCKQGQFKPLDMMRNSPLDLSVEARKFLDIMGITSKGEITQDDKSGQRAIDWYGRKIVWHCALMMNQEEQRRLIGNDNCVLFFKDEGSPFNPLYVNDMGVMPQCYVVVQPYSNQGYRVAFFQRKQILTFGPSPMRNMIVSPEDIKDFVLTKLHNASLVCLICPPLVNLLSRPRAAAIQEVVEKHMKGKLLASKFIR
eukprot:TRINITY_DN5655_c0_g1_i1.p1 TRINITY_DN5655_c0_g1~~TRINITY_DN5655_c0_g1_i1.p1  ORF type:complete len:391 (+),score=76.80 TRINITY_DN5655_c0_g1_i1:1081-2253(+)